MFPHRRSHSNFSRSIDFFYILVAGGFNAKQGTEMYMVIVFARQNANSE